MGFSQQDTGVGTEVRRRLTAVASLVTEHGHTGVGAPQHVEYSWARD